MARERACKSELDLQALGEAWDEITDSSTDTLLREAPAGGGNGMGTSIRRNLQSMPDLSAMCQAWKLPGTDSPAQGL